MQQLHLVGFTTDHKGLILGTRRGADQGSFVVNLDRAMVEQIEALLRLQAGEGGGDVIKSVTGNGTGVLLHRPKAESKLTPRQVQALLRTGSSVGEVAEEAGMSEDWVGRFAPPVLAEQARVIEKAVGLTYNKPRIGPSTQSLGESVLWNLAERGIILSGPAVDDAWTAFQQPDGGWVVRVSYLFERRRQHADWTIDMTQGVLKAVNRLGNELAYVEAGRRRPAALPPATPISASAQRAAVAPPRAVVPAPKAARPSGRLSLLASGTGISRTAPPPSSSARERPPAPAPSAVSRPESRPEPVAAAAEAAPKERRPRPLRPLSAAAPEESKAPASASPSPSTTSEKPRRERPLRAPSRMRRDESSEPPPATTTRRPVVAPRASAAQAAVEEPAPPVSSRFGPPHSARERKTSTAERFGVGRSDAATPNNHTAPGSGPDPGPAPADEPKAPRRPLRARPIVVEAEPAESDLLFAPTSDIDLDHDHDPVTAPVPALDILSVDVDSDSDGLAYGTEPAPSRGEQVLIRAGQAGTSEGAAVPRAARGRLTPEERQSRAGRRKLRRRGGEAQ
ncbi:MAG: hypothetical protein QOK39_1884 [Acidimicrobiaceae bacterium]|nr:hypothetical protein [Acidimicrobiaceae bacterium]